MDVNEISGAGGAYPIKPVAPVEASHGALESQPLEPVDEVVISSVSEMLSDVGATSEVRAERLAQIKAAIDDGTYETTDKLEAALDKLLDEVGWNDLQS